MPTDGNPGSDSQTSVDAGIDGSTLLATNDHCATATSISLVQKHTDLAVTTAGATADLAAPCAAAGQPDVFFTFTTTRRELVYADTFGATPGTTLFFASDCTTARTGSTISGDAVCSSGACGTAQSQVVALLDPGTHYLVFAGQGTATIHFRHAQVGTGTMTYLAPGSSAPTGTTSGTGLLAVCDAGGAENAYWWKTCPSDTGGVFQASTCTGTTFDTILSLQLPGAENVLCNDDACSVQSAVSTNIPAGAGLFVLAVDGFSPSKHGDYTLTAVRP
jgi:hypothetical protein